MSTNRFRHLLQRVIALLVTLSMLLPPELALAAPPANAPSAPTAQSAARGLVIGEVYHDATSLPLAGAQVTLLNASGAPLSAAVATTDARGRFQLPADVGAVRLRISRTGYTSVERSVTVQADRWVSAFDARLTLIDPNATTVTGVIGGSVTNAAGDATLTIPPAALAADARLEVTTVSAQALAGLPPAGWSPVAAAQITPADLVFNRAVASPRLRLPLPATLPPNVTAVAARWDEASGRWIALGRVTILPAQSNIEIDLSRSGQIAIFAPDAAPVAPPLPAVDAALTGVTLPAAPADLTAELLPSPRVIFTAPGVRSQVSIRTSSAAPMSSGQPLRLALTESFEFTGQPNLNPEPMEQDLLHFNVGGRSAGTGADLIVAPSLAPAAHVLRLGAIDLAVRVGALEQSGPLALTAGVTLSGSAGEQLAIPRRAAENLSARFSGLTAADFPATLPTGYSLLHAFVIDFHGGQLSLPAALSAPAPANLPTGSQLIAVRLVSVGGASRLELMGPVTLATGRLRFNGVRDEGRYAFLRTPGGLGYVSGVISGVGGRALPGAMVQAAGQPFVSISNVEGRYIVAAPAGAREVSAVDPQSNDAAVRTVTFGGAGSNTTLNLAIAASAPAIVAVSPADNAANAPLTSTVTVRFSEPVAPATTVNALRVTGAGGAVSGRLALTPDGLELSFRPDALFASQAAYTVTVDGAIADMSGNLLGASQTTRFRTVDVTPPTAPQPGQISATIPDANNITIVTGGPGAAEPGQRVVVRNVRTAADVTVNADPDDGSFRLEVTARRTDRLQIFLFDAAGNRTEVPMPRFQNADGSVIVDGSGGVITGANGIFVDIPTGSLPDGTVVRITPVQASELITAPPANFAFVGGINLDLGGATPAKYIDVGVPAPADARPDDQVLVVRYVEYPAFSGWTIVDRAFLENGRYVTASPPFKGVLAQGVYNFLKTSDIITPGPDGELDTAPDVFTDDRREDRFYFGRMARVVTGGPNGILETRPLVGSDDRVEPECVSFTSMQASLSAEAGFILPLGLPYIYPTFQYDRVTVAGFCNQPLDINIVNANTGAVILRASRVAPPTRNQILMDPAVVSDDAQAPSIVERVPPTQLYDSQQQVRVRFSERMDEASVQQNFRVADSSGALVTGTVALYADNSATFTPRTAFRLGTPYSVNLTGATDLAGNPLTNPDFSFTRSAPERLATFRGDALAQALQRCPVGKACYTSSQDMVVAGDTMFLANGLRDGTESYPDPIEPKRLAVLDVRDPSNPRLIGWHPTTTNPRSLALLTDLSFAYTRPDGSQARFDGDLLVVVGGGRQDFANARSAELELYDVTACMERAVMENCLAPNANQSLGLKFLSTGINEVQRMGVPPDPGVATKVVALHQRVGANPPGGPNTRQDVAVAYVLVVPIGIVAVDLTRAFNVGSTREDRFAPDALQRGSFFDLAVLKNFVVAADMPASGSPRLVLFGGNLVPVEQAPVPFAFRIAAAPNMVFDVDEDGNIGVPEEADGDNVLASDEFFDFVLVTGGGRVGATGYSEVIAVDFSHRTDLQHDAPLLDAADPTGASRVVSRIPLPGPGFDISADADAYLAYVNIPTVGLHLVDLSHLGWMVRGDRTWRVLFDTNNDGVDERILLALRNQNRPDDPLRVGNCGVAAAPLAPRNSPLLCLAWETSGMEFYGYQQLVARSPVKVTMQVDTVNNDRCYQAETLDFALTHPAQVTIRIDNRVITQNGQPLQNRAFEAGRHSVPIPPDAVDGPGEHPFTIEAVFDPNQPAARSVAEGVVIYELEMNAALPIGHTMVMGVDLWNGTLTHSAQDIQLPGRGLGLNLTRSYSSGGVETGGPLGAGWTHAYNVRLVRNGCGNYVVVGGEGSGNTFRNPRQDASRAALFASSTFTVAANALFYEPQIGYHSTLIRSGDNPDVFDFFTPARIRHHFQREGQLPGEVYTLRFMEDANGNRLTFDYLAGDGDPTTLDSVTDSAGKQLRFRYSTIANQKRIVAATVDVGDADLGIDVRYGYDTLGNLTVVTRTTPYAGLGINDERVQRYVYSTDYAADRHNLRRYIDPNGNATEYLYHAITDTIPGWTAAFEVSKDQMIREIREPEGVTTRFVYTMSTNPAAPNQRAVSDPRPGVAPTVYTLNSYGAAVRVERPLGAVTQTIWCTELPLPAECSRRGALRGAEIDALGQRTLYGYDALGNVVTTTVDLANVSAPHIRPVVDADGQTVTQIATYATYDPLFSRMTSETDAEGRTTWYCIDSPAAPPAGSPCQPTSGRTGNVLAVIDPAGFRTEYTYDANGNVTAMTDSRGFTTRYLDYTAMGQPQRVIDPLGNITTHVYDARGRLVETWDTFGHHTQYAYDGLDRRIEVRRLTDRSERGADQIERTRYSATGKVIRLIDGLGQITEHRYDGLDRLVTVVDLGVRQADGSTVVYTTTMTYDAASNKVSETDRRGVTTQHNYDALKRLTRSEVVIPGGPNKVIFAADYDVMGNKRTTTNLHGFTTEYIYDARYRKVAEALPFTHSYTDTPFQQARVETGYDLTGNVVRKTDANGNVVRTVYDARELPVRVIDPLGGEIVYTYDAAGNKTREEHIVTGVVTAFAYDALNRLTAMTQTVPFAGPDQTTAVYVTTTSYDDADNAIISTDARGFRTRADRDGLDRLVEEVQALGVLDLTTTYTYDGAGNVASVRDPQGNDIDVAYTYDGLGRKLTAEYVATPGDVGAVIERSFYDGAGNLVRVIDRRGIEQRMTYDALGRKLTQRLVESISNGGAELLLEEIIYFDGQDGDGLVRMTTYDANRNATTTYTDSLGRIVRVDDPDAGAGRRFLYDSVNKRGEIDERGNRAEADYDALNRQIAVREIDADGVLRSSVSTNYDDATLRVITTDRNGNQSIEQRDGLNRLVRVQRSGATMAAHYGQAVVTLDVTLYDGNSNVVRTVDGAGNVVTFEYDAADRKIAMTEGVGSPVAATTRWTYDRAGNILTVKDGRAHGGAFDARYTYDARYRKITAEDAEGGVTTYGYDAADNLVAVTEANGAAFTTRFRYGELGEMLAVDETPRAGANTPAGVTRYLYDANRNRIAQQDAAGNLVTYRYDAFNRVIALMQHTAAGQITAATMRGTDPTGAEIYATQGDEATALRWSYSYDSEGNKTLIVDARSQRVEQRYDYRNRLVAKVYTNAAAPTLDFQMQRIDYAYDGNSNTIAVTETKRIAGGVAVEVTSFTYDPLDRIQTRTRRDYDQPSGRTTQYDYNLVGNRTRLVDPDNVVTTYTYDARNRLQTVTTDAGVTTYAWWEDSLLRSVTYPNGSVHDRGGANAYDRADRVVTVINTRNLASLPFSRFDYTYDANGNRLTQVEQQAAIDAGQPVTTTYTYDTLNRMVTVDYGAGRSLRYTYSATGNRLTEVGVDPANGQPVDRTYLYAALADRPGVTYDGVNTLTRIVDNRDATRTITYEYDANLNQTARITTAGRADYRYDVRDQMVAAETDGGRVTFDYDFNRMRVKKATAGAETRYLYDDASVLVEYGGAASGFATLRKYDYGYRLLALTEVNGAARASQFYLIDGLGSTANLTDEAGDLAQSLRYDAWGRTLAEVGASSNLRRFTGHYYDTETGLHYFGARYYDAEVGRFTTQDAYLGMANTPPSLHRYLYAYANPARFVDPTGHAAEEANGGAADGAPAGLTQQRRGGYTLTTAVGSAANALGAREWVNSEGRRITFNVPEKVQFKLLHAASWAYAADDLAKETSKKLEDWVVENPGLLSVGLATVSMTGVDLLASATDVLKLGEGAAEYAMTGNGWALAEDTMRLYDLLSTLVGWGGFTTEIKGSVAWLKEAGHFAAARAVKRVGLKHMAVEMSDDMAKQAYAKVAGTRYVLGTRSVDPWTRHHSNKLAQQGYMPKGVEDKEKTIRGELFKMKQVDKTIDPGVWEHIRKRSDDDLAWVWDKVEQRYLGEDEVMDRIVNPINELLPPSYRLMHGAHNNSLFFLERDYKLKGYPDWKQRAQKTHGIIGAVGPVTELSWDGAGQLSKRQLSAQQARQVFHDQGWAWHPKWDEVKAWSDELQLTDLAWATSYTAIYLNYNAPVKLGHMLVSYGANLAEEK